MLLVDKNEVSKNSIHRLPVTPGNIWTPLIRTALTIISPSHPSSAVSYNSAVMAAVIAQEKYPTARCTPIRRAAGRICFS